MSKDNLMYQQDVLVERIRAQQCNIFHTPDTVNRVQESVDSLISAKDRACVQIIIGMTVNATLEMLAKEFEDE